MESLDNACAVKVGFIPELEMFTRSLFYQFNNHSVIIGEKKTDVKN